MSKVLTFKVEVEGLENKIWRKIEIKDDSLVSDLAYIILATFETYSNEFFVIKHGDNQYDIVNRIYDNEICKSVMSISLDELDFSNNKMFMHYDLENEITFVITYLGNKEIDNKNKYPKIIDGEGRGILDFVSGSELKEIVLETDKLGHSNYSTIVEVDGVDEEEFFDYREFDLNDNNFLSGCNYSFIKDSYESLTLVDMLRIIYDRRVLHVKIDTMEIVRPFDYKKKYLPDNYKNLTSEELDKLNIPTNEELNIYMLPFYRDLNHKYIMTTYVKRCVIDKEIRQALFYCLRNHDYMEKFYNLLRKYHLFYEYLDFSKEYYQDILNNWMDENKINRKK